MINNNNNNSNNNHHRHNYSHDKRAKVATSMENRLETVFIKDIHAGMRNITLTCIVLEVGPPVMLKEKREVRTVKVADQTACINLAVWDDCGQYINASDIIRVTKTYATLWHNCLTLYTSKVGTLEKIGEFCMVFNDQINMSEMAAPTPPPPPNNAPNGGSGNNSSSSSNNNNNNNNGGGGNGGGSGGSAGGGGGGGGGGGNGSANAANSGGGYGSRSAAAVAGNNHGSGQPHAVGASGSSRYDLPARNASRNGQPSDESGGAVNPRGRAERERK